MDPIETPSLRPSGEDVVARGGVCDTGDTRMGGYKLSALPKWAQEYVLRLERTVADLDRRLADGPRNTDTFALRHTRPSTPLDKGQTVRFSASGDPSRGPYVDCRFWTSGKESVLEVMASEHIIVLPVVANVINVRFR